MDHSSCQVTSILNAAAASIESLPLYTSTVPAGLPFHGDDHIETSLDLNRYLIKDTASTFLVRVSGSSMKDAGIQDGDILVVDRALTARSGQIVIAAINGELTVKRLKKDGTTIYLESENPSYPSIQLKKEEDLLIWGIVTAVIHKF